MVFDKKVENELWNNYMMSRNNENRNELIVFYNSFVKVAIGKLVPNYNKYLDKDDLMSCGVIGLIDAIEKFDFSKGVKFETYASIRIRGTIIDQLRKQDWIPSNLRHKIKNIERAYSEFEARNGKVPTEHEMAQYLNISVKELKNLLEISYTSNIINFDDVIMNSIEETEIVNSEYNPEYRLEKNYIKEMLVQSIESLNEKERMVISLYYYDELTLKEIGVVLGVSESRVSQIHSKILLKLKGKLNAVNAAV